MGDDHSEVLDRGFLELPLVGVEVELMLLQQLQNAAGDLEVFTVPHINPLDSTGFLWILRDSCGLQWTSIPIYLYGSISKF